MRIVLNKDKSMEVISLTTTEEVFLKTMTTVKVDKIIIEVSVNTKIVVIQVKKMSSVKSLKMGSLAVMSTKEERCIILQKTVHLFKKLRDSAHLVIQCDD